MYKAAGIIIHPLSNPKDDRPSPGKRPLLPRWQKLTTCPTDEELSNYFVKKDYNVGAVCGKASDLMAIDVDWYIRGMWDDILKDVDTSNWVKQYRTEGRWHWLFRFDSKLELKHAKALGIDLLGESGNVVMAPSVHESGDVYRIDGDVTKRPHMPDNVIGGLRKYLDTYQSLKTTLGRCRPVFKILFYRVFEDEDLGKDDDGNKIPNPLYHDLNIFRTIEGRQRTLAMCAELLANGGTNDQLMLFCMMAFGNTYNEKDSRYQISKIKPSATAKTSTIKADSILSQFYVPGKNDVGNSTHGEWNGMLVPPGYSVNGCINKVVYQKQTDDKIDIPFCMSPAITSSVGTNIDDGGFWLEITFHDMFGKELKEWISQKDALSRRGIMELASKGLNLIEKNSSTMNEYISQCLSANSARMPQRIVAEKNGWKCDNTLFAFGDRGFRGGEIVEIIPLQKEAHAGLKVVGSIENWIEAVKPIIHLPLVRLKMYAVFTAPLLRLLNVQSFILDHNGESSTGKTFTNDLAMSMIGDADTLRFNGDTTKTAAEILAEMYTDLPLYLDETGTQQSEDVLKTLIYMIGNEQGRMRGKKDGGLRETSKWKTVTLTTGEKSITSHRSFSGEMVRAIDVRGGLPKGVIEDVKVAADIRKENYGHFAEPYFMKLEEYREKLPEMYQMARERYITKDNVKTNRLAGSYAAILVAGMLLEDIFSDVGLEPTEPHEVIDYFFAKGAGENKVENYSTRALQDVVDWTKSKHMCFCDLTRPDDNQQRYGAEFYGWIDGDYIDVIPKTLRKMLQGSGYDFKRVVGDWKEAGILVCNTGRNDFNTTKDNTPVRVIRFNRGAVYDAVVNQVTN